MFTQKSIKTEPIPERVYELCKIVSKGEINNKTVKEYMEPQSINTSNTSYYSIVRNVCVSELKLIEVEGENLKFVGEKKVIKNMDTFRFFCNSIAFNDRESDFYKVANAYLESNDKWLKYNTVTDVNIRTAVQDEYNMELVSEEKMLGMRFWMSFLGFGYIQEKGGISFLPNMHIALQDFCKLSKLEKNKEYTAKEFFEGIYDCASVALCRSMKKKSLNLAMSSAIRQMHDNKEIIIKNNLDSKETWALFPDETHEFTKKFTHIIFKGVNRK